MQQMSSSRFHSLKTRRHLFEIIVLFIKRGERMGRERA